ncbi:MAG: PQQ-binding-like beta-propeller repeat protein [Gemmataceae bacterium]
MKYLLYVAILTLFPGLSLAGDWPQFHGPRGTGVSKEKNLPTKWSKDKGIAWKAEITGRGLSNPVIADGRIYVTSCSGPDQKRLHVLCFDEKTGKKMWERNFWGTGSNVCHPTTSMAAPTPVTDGKNVYAIWGTYDIVGLDNDGNLLWYRPLVLDYPTLACGVGHAASPTLYKGTLIVPLENAGESLILGLKAKTGQTKWTSARKSEINFVTPIVIRRDGKPEVIVQSRWNCAAIDPTNGKVRWETAPASTMSPVTTPVFQDGLLFTAAREGSASFFALRPSADNAEPEVVWKSRTIRLNYVSPIVYRGTLYTLSDRGRLIATDPRTGKEIAYLNLRENYWGSMVAADGKLYMVGTKGTTTVVKLGGKMKIIARNELNDRIVTTPAIANGRIYLRSDNIKGENTLYAIGKK